MIAMPVATNLNAKTSIFHLALPATLILGIGTGGERTLDYLRIIEAKLVLNPHHVQPLGSTDGSVSVETAGRDLSFIRSVLKISTSDLAMSLGVSRQAIYNWKAGSFIKAQNLSKLANLLSAAEVFTQARMTVTPQMLDRKLSGGKTFLESITGGANGAETAAMLVNLANREAEHRRSLDEILAENMSRPELDYGSPALSEG
jgi:transcriptional regulator with XRE-family HTH domain